MLQTFDSLPGFPIEKYLVIVSLLAAVPVMALYWKTFTQGKVNKFGNFSRVGIYIVFASYFIMAIVYALFAIKGFF
jgi:hypothetical protein